MRKINPRKPGSPCGNFTRLLICAAQIALVATLSTHIVMLASNETGKPTMASGLDRNYFSALTLWDLVLFAAFVALSSLLLWMLEKLITFCRPRLFADQATKLNRRAYLLIFVVILVAWTPWLLSWFPGGVTTDTYMVIAQAQGSMQLTNRHVLLYVLCWRACYKVSILLGHGMYLCAALVLCLQTMLLNLVATYSLGWLGKRGARMPVIIAVAGFYALCPLFPMMALSHWKDTFFGIFLFWFLLNYIDALQGGITRPFDSLAFIVSALLVAFSRNNGLYVLLICALVLLIEHRGVFLGELRLLWIPLFSTIALCVIIQGPVYKALDLDSSAAVESLGVPIQQVAYTLSSDNDIAQEGLDYFDSIMPIEKWKGCYKPLIVDNIKWDDDFDAEIIESNPALFMQHYFRLGLSHPASYIKAFLLSNCGFWNPLVGWTEEVGYARLDMDFPGRAGLETIDIAQAITGVSLQAVLRPHVYLSPGLFSTLMLIVAITCIYMQNPKKSLWLTPMAALLFTLLIATPLAYCMRYSYALIIATPLMLLMGCMGNGPATPCRLHVAGSRGER